MTNLQLLIELIKFKEEFPQYADVADETIKVLFEADETIRPQKRSSRRMNLMKKAVCGNLNGKLNFKLFNLFLTFFKNCSFR